MILTWRCSVMVAREKHRSHYLLEITGRDWLSPVKCEARGSNPGNLHRNYFCYK